MARVPGSEDTHAAELGEPSRLVEFALDSFEVGDGRLVVAGRWYGVTGRRFMRPVLQAHGQRRLIALLDHKPWSADDGAPWLAAFPDDGYAGASRLQVAPDIAVELPAAGPGAGDGKPRPARLARAPARRSPVEAEPAPADTPPPAALTEPGRETQDARRTAEVEAERDAALAELDRLGTEVAHARAEADTLRVGHDRMRHETERLEADVARLRTEAQRAMADRNTAQAELERLRRRPASPTYIAPRPMAFREFEPGPSRRIRALAAFLVIAAIAVLVGLLFGVV